MATYSSRRCVGVQHTTFPGRNLTCLKICRVCNESHLCSGSSVMFYLFFFGGILRPAE